MFFTFSNKPILFFLILISFFCLNGCCTEKDCSRIVNRPEINISFSGFSDEELYSLEKLIVDKNTLEILATKHVNNPEYHSVLISVENNFTSLKDEFYVFVTDVSRDTIYNIQFTETYSKVKCNTCFLGDGRADVVTIHDFSYYYKGIKYTKSKLTIIK